MKANDFNTYAVLFIAEDGNKYEKLVGMQNSKKKAMETFNRWFPNISAIDARLCTKKDRFFKGLKRIV